MTYELAKQLKEAEFPKSSGFGGFLVDNRKISSKVISPNMGLLYEKKEDDEIWPIPSLSELIEVCGEKFGRLEHCKKDEIEFWIAYSSRIVNELNIPAYIFQQGQSPEEAVCRLWLALNKK